MSNEEVDDVALSALGTALMADVPRSGLDTSGFVTTPWVSHPGSRKSESETSSSGGGGGGFSGASGSPDLESGEGASAVSQEDGRGRAVLVWACNGGKDPNGAGPRGPANPAPVECWMPGSLGFPRTTVGLNVLRPALKHKGGTQSHLLMI